MVAKYDFFTHKNNFTTNLIIFTTLFYDSDNIFSIGLTAFFTISGATSTVGQPNFNALYIFLSVFIFIYSHSVQLNLLHPRLPLEVRDRKLR